jgi:hypothetical protein
LQAGVVEHPPREGVQDLGDEDQAPHLTTLALRPPSPAPKRIGQRGRRPCRTTEESIMAVIQNTTLIERAPDEVFDYLVDLRNELEWNPRVESMEKLTNDPLGVGTTYLANRILGDEFS